MFDLLAEYLFIKGKAEKKEDKIRIIKDDIISKYDAYQLYLFIEVIWYFINNNITESVKDIQKESFVPTLPYPLNQIEDDLVKAACFVLFYTSENISKSQEEVFEVVIKDKYSIDRSDKNKKHEYRDYRRDLKELIKNNYDEILNNKDKIKEVFGYKSSTAKSAPSIPKLLEDFPDKLNDFNEYKVNKVKHLIYAYMIENTRIYDIINKVIYEFLYDEKLSIPKENAKEWLELTETILYKEAFPSLLYPFKSLCRPDSQETRNNSYYRLFGMMLGHKKVKDKPLIANTKFVTVFEEFLYEVRQAINNVNNQSGENQTDKATIESLVKQLKYMLNDRKNMKNLDKQELYFTAAMSWLDLSLSYDLPLIVEMNAEANTQADRLRIISEKVKENIHTKAYNLFELAKPLSDVLLYIESFDTENENDQVEVFYDQNNVGKSFKKSLETIIHHWSIATGRDIKNLKKTNK